MQDRQLIGAGDPEAAEISPRAGPAGMPPAHLLLQTLQDGGVTLRAQRRHLLMRLMGGAGLGGGRDRMVGLPPMEHPGHFPTLGDGLQLFDRHQVLKKAVAFLHIFQSQDRAEELVVFPGLELGSVGHERPSFLFNTIVRDCDAVIIIPSVSFDKQGGFQYNYAVINCPDVLQLQGSSFKPAINIPCMP